MFNICGKNDHLVARFDKYLELKYLTRRFASRFLLQNAQLFWRKFMWTIICLLYPEELRIFFLTDLKSKKNKDQQIIKTYASYNFFS